MIKMKFKETNWYLQDDPVYENLDLDSGLISHSKTFGYTALSINHIFIFN